MIGTIFVNLSAGCFGVTVARIFITGNDWMPFAYLSLFFALAAIFTEVEK